MVNYKKISLIFISIILLGSSLYGYKFYSDLKRATNKMYQETPRDYSQKRPQVIERKKSFSILLLGIDTGSVGREDKGRSDSLMVMTVNPQKNITTVLSIPRDTYVNISGYGMDKINHAYALGGADLSLLTVHTLLDIPIDFYVELDMKGIKEVVDIIDGISIDNSFNFSYEMINFKKGLINLNGDETLKYIRMRYDDPKGDYGRQERHRKVVSSILEKGTKLSLITNYNKFLNILESNIKTNLTFNDLYKIQLDKSYRKSISNVMQLQLEGMETMFEGISYEVIDRAELIRVSKFLKEELNL